MTVKRLRLLTANLELHHAVKTLLTTLPLLMVLACGSAQAQVKPVGVAGDGKTDDTVALQAALNAAGKVGGEVFLPSARYLIAGTLTVPTGVTVRGSWDEAHHGAWDKGTTLLLTGGRGQENGQAAITLQQSSALRGVTMLWPEETADNIVPYPWAIHGVGMHNTVENVTFVNAYQGIKIGQPFSELHLIRNVFGCVLRRGIFIDSTSDIGRIENVHFNTHYWMRSGYPGIQGGNPGQVVPQYTTQNLEAFIFGRTDWEYVLNTFVWGARIGYRFIKTPDGACNGQFMGIGADYCDVGLQVDAIQPIGIQVTNGEFTAFVHPTSSGILVSPGVVGAMQFMNCNFWSTPGGAAVIHGNVQATFNTCHFADAAKPGVIVANRGHVAVTNCSFAGGGAAVVLQPGARAALITGNLQSGGLMVENGIGANAQVGMNEGPREYPVASLSHYRVKIGAAGDADFLGTGWYGSEQAQDGTEALGPAITTARWTNGNAMLRLPVTPGQAYTLKLTYTTRANTPPETVSVARGGSAPLVVGKTETTMLQIPAAATMNQHTVDVALRGQPWSPSVLYPGNNDTRELGVRVFVVEMQANGANGPLTDLTDETQ
ncbi:MAG: hypothetical protein JO316_26925 [Abitibacteriaceae bacterium]|nr:hypothetical protein [Abditibacteriaceae bacterium]